MSKSNRFSPEVRERAVRMVQEHRGDSYDNALAETINGPYKAQLIERLAAQAPSWWRSARAKG